MPRILPFLVCAVLAPAAAARAQSAVPVLIELFTSEGCSSCPPADAWVRQLDARQPMPDEQLIILSEHVDYWDRGGWKDPYSSHALTLRQQAYARSLDLPDVYTPQLLVDGTDELKTTDPVRVARILAGDTSAAKIPVRITSVTVDTATPRVLHARIEADGGPVSGDVYVAVALDHAQSDVLGGENQGRRLAYVAVVEDLTKIGKLEKRKNFSRDFQQKLGTGMDPSNLRIVAFVQQRGPGRVLGAAMRKAPFR